MKRSQGQFIAQWRRTGKLNAHIEETFSGHALVTVFGRRAEVERTFAEENDELYEASFKAQFVSGLIMPVMMFIGNLNYVVVAVVGGLRVANGTLTLGEVQAFIQYSRQFTQPLTQVASMMNLLQSGVASAERVFELLDADEQVPDSTTGRPRPRAAARCASSTCRSATTPTEPLIEDLSLVASPGQTVAIVGPTGAGKTTLVNLVMRFYELDGGRITLDGIDITAMPRAALRGRIGMVLQDTWLFEGTIRDNILYGRPDATEDELLEAARATFVDRFVHSLPDGYDTVVDEDGGNLSAGERQLLTIARAFLADPALLILDEATSSVDTRTELLLQHAMAALRTDRTSFVIAHRLSTIRDADLILVMEDGKIVEQGDHESLLAARRRLRAALPVAVRRRRSLTGWRTRETSGANAPGSGRGSWCSTSAGGGAVHVRRAAGGASGSRPAGGRPRWRWGWPSPYAASRGRSWSCWPRSTGICQLVAGELVLVADAGYTRGLLRAGGAPARLGAPLGPRRRAPCPRWCSPSRSAPASSATSAPVARTPSRSWRPASLALLVAGGGWALGYVRWQSRARITAQVQAGLERERTRIAADMHDLVAHTWAVVAAQADGARYALGTPDGDRLAAEALDVIAETARGSIADLRDLLAELRYQEPADATRPRRPVSPWSTGCAPRAWTCGWPSTASRPAPGRSRSPRSGCWPSRSPTRSSTATWPTRSRSRRTGATATVSSCATGSVAPPATSGPVTAWPACASGWTWPAAPSPPAPPTGPGRCSAALPEPVA